MAVKECNIRNVSKIRVEHINKDFTKWDKVQRAERVQLTLRPDSITRSTKPEARRA